MSATPEIEADILRRYRMNPKRFTPFKVSKACGVSVGTVLAVINSKKGQLTAEREHSDGHGRADLRRYIIAKRRVTDNGWDNNLPAVAEARTAFCAGTHTMATHRDGPWLFLCLIPLQKHRTPQPKYFMGEDV